MTRQLFEKFVRGECTEEEHRQIAAWMADPAHDALRQQWMNEHWARQDVTNEPDIQLERLWQAITVKTNLPAVQPAAPVRRLHPYRWLSLAACLLVLLVSAVLVYRFNRTSADSPEIVYQTQYGQLMRVVLPDSSAVVLNGNSTLRFKPSWKPSQNREVWLDGEGFFSVTHKANHQKFLVHTSNMFGVEVLGTEFSVFRQQSHTRVVLNNGKIKVRIEDSAPGESEQFVIKPGELVEFDEADYRLLKKQVNPDVYSSWKDRQLVFEDTPLSEIAARLEATYGLKVDLHPDARDRHLSGKVAVENLDILLEALSSTFQLTITRQADTIRIQPNRPQL